MIKIGNLDINSFKVGGTDCSIYLGDTKLYPQSTPPTPVSSCYEIIPQPISQYASTTYDSVYSWSDAKWYMKNNLSQYEEYGIYDIVENISSATTYNGKLAVVGTTEYEYSGGSWVVVGTYEDASTTYEITGEDPYEYKGVELSTTFKIPTADIEELGGWLNLDIDTQDGGRLTIDTTRYRYMGSSSKTGTVTNDNDYYYYELPDIDSVVIQYIQYWYSTPIHLIASSKQASVEYSAKTAPSSALTYSSVADMEAVSCPTVGVGQYCYTNGQAYKYSSNEEWVTAQDSEIAVKGVFVDGTVKMLPVGAITSIPKNLIISRHNGYDYTLKSVYVGNGVTSIGDDAFNGCKGITSVTLSDDVTTIGDSAFWGDEGILRFNSDTNGVMNISDSVTSISSYAFAILDSITTLNIGSGMTVIEGSVFPSMIGLTAVTIPNTITKIGSAAFLNCYSLKTVIIPSSVTSIEAGAFRQCSGLTKVCCLATTPPTMTNNNVFESTNNCPIYVPCESVEAYKAATNWSTYANRITCVQPFSGKYKFTLTDDSVVSGVCGSSTELEMAEASAYTSTLKTVEIGDCVTSIGHQAFNSCTRLTEVVLPDSITSIGQIAFQYCISLTSIDIPSGVTTIDWATFNDCSGLTSVNIPDSVTTIGDNAFNDCSSLTSITIPNSVTTIGANAFYGCTGLTSITVEATTPPTLSPYDVFGNTNDCPIYVPSASVNAYKAASRWSKYASRIQAIP